MSGYCLFASRKYFPGHKLPENVVATTDAKAALSGADYCFHAVPVQVVLAFLYFLISQNIYFQWCIAFDSDLSIGYLLYQSPSLQFSTPFLEGVAAYVDPGLPFISLSKGLELSTLRIMSQIIPRALKNPRQPFIALSGPSFASELMNKLPTGLFHINK